jgi:hypothetical protein
VDSGGKHRNIRYQEGTPGDTGPGHLFADIVDHAAPDYNPVIALGSADD